MEVEASVDVAPQQRKNTGAADHLWQRYFETKATSERNRLVLFYAPLVRLVASRIAKSMSSFQTIEELCSSGQLGLMDAIERFNPAEGNQFSTYATIRIQGAIIDELRREDVLPKRMRARVKTYQIAKETLEAKLHRSPTLKELAEHLETSVAEIIEVDDIAVLSSYLVPLSLVGDHAVRHFGTTPFSEPSDAAEASAMRQTVKSALLRITERQRQVLILHYLEGFQKCEVADMLKIDRSRVTQLIQQGLRNLRAQLENPQDDHLDKVF